MADILAPCDGGPLEVEKGDIVKMELVLVVEPGPALRVGGGPFWFVYYLYCERPMAVGGYQDADAGMRNGCLRLLW